MIQKRYQYNSSKGIQWTPWKSFEKDNTKLSYLQAEEKWQLKPRLLNEYRVV